jgi:putative peptidoglycan lipid II flippase
VGKKLFKATAIVSSMTLLSRLFGFIRDMLIARIFGVNIATDAFFVAFKIPNLMRRLFSEGAFTHAVLPVITKQAEQDDKFALRQFIGKTAGTLAAWAALLTSAAMALAPVLIAILAPGFAWQGQQYDLAVTLLRITLPFGACMVLVAYAGAILNAHNRYVIPALTPIILNVCMIVATLWIAPLMDMPIMSLAWAVVAAGVVQLLFQIPSLMRLCLLPKLSIRFKDRDVKLILNKLLPAIFSSSVTQINLLFDTLIASFLVSGSVSWLYYSDRLVEFPMGILGMGLATVILPNLAKHHVLDDAQAFSSTLDWGLRLALLAGLPATIGLYVLAEPTLSTLFQYNEFTINDVHKAGLSLKAYSVGLLGFLFIKILVPGFTSRHDLKTPVRFGILSMITSLAFNLALVFPLAHAGLALATSLGALLNGALLLIKLLKDSVYKPETGWLLFLARIAFASGLMTFCLYYFVDSGWWSQWETTERIFNLLKWIIIGCMVYVLALAISGLRLKHLTVTNDRIASFDSARN